MICSIEGCEKRGDASRGWCWTHYQRFRAYGDPMLGGRKGRPPVRKHGGIRRYQDGCRCDLCVSAQKGRYKAHYNRPLARVKAAARRGVPFDAIASEWNFGDV